MKQWSKPAVCELNIQDTAQNLFGKYYDGGYIGDGHHGILSWEKPECPEEKHS